MSNFIVIELKKGQLGEQPLKCSHVDYHTLNSLMVSVIKAHSKVLDVLSLAPLWKIEEMYAMLNGSTVYSSMDCNSGCHHLTPFTKGTGQI